MANNVGCVSGTEKVEEWWFASGFFDSRATSPPNPDKYKEGWVLNRRLVRTTGRVLSRKQFRFTGSWCLGAADDLNGESRSHRNQIADCYDLPLVLKRVVWHWALGMHRALNLSPQTPKISDTFVRGKVSRPLNYSRAGQRHGVFMASIAVS